MWFLSIGPGREESSRSHDEETKTRRSAQLPSQARAGQVSGFDRGAKSRILVRLCQLLLLVDRSSDRATAAGTRSLHVYSCGADCVTGQALGPGQTIPLPEGGTHGGPDPELKFTWGETKAQEGRQLGQSFAAQGRPKVHRYPRINSHEPDTHLPLPSWGYSLSHCPSLAPAWVLSVGQGLGSCELKRAS